MNTDIALTVLETAGLVRPVAATPEVEYAFRHGLLQEAAYRLLLKEERERLHREVGVAIEDRYPQRTDELAAVLGNHFLLGGDRQRALRYLRLAAERARGRFANAEALEYYSAALQVARELDEPLERAGLLRERGRTHEIVGDFEAARMDHEAALALGRELEEPWTEWRALLDLGKLWAARDYEKTGAYFKSALEIARAIGDPAVVARSLNRLGNWHINLGHTEEATRHHREALDIFERIGEQEGLAETLDFLGMSSMISSNPTQGAQYFDRAIQLLRSLGNKQRLASALTSYALRINTTQTETTVGVDSSAAEAMASFDEAIQLTREIGWKSGESFALWTRAFLLNSLGELDQALASSQQALDLARSIDHTQWMAAASCTLGRTYLERMDHDPAVDLLEQARSLARSINSRHWMGVATGLTAGAYLARKEGDRAQAVLDDFADPLPGMTMLGDRLYWMARGELLLAQERFEQALELFDRLIARAPGYSEGRVIARLFGDRGRAYLGLGQLEPARDQLEAALLRSQAEGSKTLEWRLRGQMARIEYRSGNDEAAERELAAGRAVIEGIGEMIADAEDRLRFLTAARARLEGRD